MSEVNLDSITNWKMQKEVGYVANVPSMPEEERKALVNLMNKTSRWTSDERRLKDVLMRKAQYRASRDADRS